MPSGDGRLEHGGTSHTGLGCRRVNEGGVEAAVVTRSEPAVHDVHGPGDSPKTLLVVLLLLITVFINTSLFWHGMGHGAWHGMGHRMGHEIWYGGMLRFHSHVR